MASIDYREAKNEITKLFNAENDGRKIIFWYDPPMNFKEDIVCYVGTCPAYRRNCHRK